MNLIFSYSGNLFAVPAPILQSTHVGGVGREAAIEE